MFFIQACQGDQLDHGVKMVRTEHDAGATTYRFVTYQYGIGEPSKQIFGQSWEFGPTVHWDSPKGKKMLKKRPADALGTLVKLVRC